MRFILLFTLFTNKVALCHTKVSSAKQLKSHDDTKSLTEESNTAKSQVPPRMALQHLVQLKKMKDWSVMPTLQHGPDSIGSPARKLGKAKVAESKSTVDLKQSVKQLNWLTELGLVFKIGLPLGFSSCARILQLLSINVVLGRSDTIVLAAVAASSIWTQITDNMVITAIGQISTLCGQAFGAGNKKLVGTWLQIALLGVTIAGIPAVALRWLTTPVLKLLSISPQIAELAGKFAVWGQATFFLNAWYYTVQRFYLAQQIVIPDAVVDFIFIFVNVGIVYLFVDVFKWGQDGIVGAALGLSVSNLLRLIVYVLYCWGRGYHRDTWFGWSWKEIAHRERWKTLVKMVGPAAISGLLQQLQFQFCSLLAVRLGPSCGAAFNLCLSLLLLSFTSVFSLGGATGNRLSRLLGAGEPLGARFCSRVGLVACWSATLFMAVLLAAVMGPFSRLASHDLQVQTYLQQLRWTAAAATFLLGGFISMVTIVSTQGRPGLAAIITPIMCWGFGFPISFFSSKTRGLLGIFDGLDIGYGLAFISLLIPYCLSNWPQLAEKAQKRSEAKKRKSVDDNAKLAKVLE